MGVEGKMSEPSPVADPSIVSAEEFESNILLFQSYVNAVTFRNSEHNIEERRMKILGN
jgi:hypothetical protein